MGVDRHEDSWRTAPSGMGGPDWSAVDAVAVTPHDTNELANWPRALWIGGAGVITVVTMKGTTTPFTVPAGTLLPIRVKIVKATGTTATLIVAMD